LKAEIIAVANQKGGVGKSTTAEALAEGLSRRGHKAVLIDLDSQGNVTLTSAIGETSKPTVYDLLTGRADAQEVTQQRKNRVDIIPADGNLARLDVELTATGKEYKLKEALKPLAVKYKYIVMDTPPALGILTINALTAANRLIIPAQADLYSLQGIGQLYETIKAIKAYTNPDLSLKGILLTRHNARSILSRDMADTAKTTAKQIKTFLYKTVIRESVALREAQASCQSIFEYAPKSNAALDYNSFIDEFLKRKGS